MNLSKNMNIVAVQTLTSTGSTAASNSAQVDTQGYDGVIFFARYSNNGGVGITLTAQGSTTSGSGDQSYANATAASTVAAGCVFVDLYKPTMRYARSQITISATDCVCPGVTAFLYGPSVIPVSHSSTSVHDSTFIAGATT